MKFELLSDHATAVSVLPAGTIIGDGTPYPMIDANDKPFIGLSSQMKPLDKEACDYWEKNKRPGWAKTFDDKLPLTPASSDAEAPPMSNVKVEKTAVDKLLEDQAAARDAEEARKANAAATAKGNEALEGKKVGSAAPTLSK